MVWQALTFRLSLSGLKVPNHDCICTQISENGGGSYFIVEKQQKKLLHQYYQLGQSWRRWALFPHILCKWSGQHVNRSQGCKGRSDATDDTRKTETGKRQGTEFFWSLKLKKFSGSDRFWENVGMISTLPVSSLWGKARKCQQTHRRRGCGGGGGGGGIGKRRVNVAQDKYEGKIWRANLRRQDKHSRPRA